MREALVIETDCTVRPVDLPSDPEGRSSALRVVAGRFAESARYHPRALLYVNADGAEVPNVAAWALACAWRGLDLDYSLYGPVVVTAASPGDPLPEDLAGQVQAAAEAVAEILAEAQPPSGLLGGRDPGVAGSGPFPCPRGGMTGSGSGAGFGRVE